MHESITRVAQAGLQINWLDIAIILVYLVGIVGLGPTAGILAIGLHSMGTYGKLFAEAITRIHEGESISSLFDGVDPTHAPPRQRSLFDRADA